MHLLDRNRRLHALFFATSFGKASEERYLLILARNSSPLAPLKACTKTIKFVPQKKGGVLG
jgi:hypothetical protein